jgi:hypothetical protein
MGALQVSRMLALALLATVAYSTSAQVPRVQTFQIHITDPAYTGLPVWIYAELNFPLEIRYPYREDQSRRDGDEFSPGWFGDLCRTQS